MVDYKKDSIEEDNLYHDFLFHELKLLKVKVERTDSSIGQLQRIWTIITTMPDDQNLLDFFNMQVNTVLLMWHVFRNWNDIVQQLHFGFVEVFANGWRLKVRKATVGMGPCKSFKMSKCSTRHMLCSQSETQNVISRPMSYHQPCRYVLGTNKSLK